MLIDDLIKALTSYKYGNVSIVEVLHPMRIWLRSLGHDIAFYVVR